MSEPTARSDGWQLPIPEHRKSIYEYYKLVFTEDGCPMRRMPDGLIFHPMLGAYLIMDYVRWYELTHERQYLEYAMTIATQALKHAKKLHHSLVFFYDPESNLSAIPKRFYSALTQARYIESLLLLERYIGNRFKHEIKLICNSLTIPVADGGCLVVKEWGWITEEYPSDPPLYTLNGWLSVITVVVKYKDLLAADGIILDHFIQNNLKALEHLLPLYDAEFCANSRYQLTGFTRVRVLFNKNSYLNIRNFSVSIPGEGIYPQEDAGSRWRNYIERKEAGFIQLNVVLSLVSFPVQNILSFSYDADRDCTIKIQMACGEYQPNLSALSTSSWYEIKAIPIRKGASNVQIELPWTEENLFAYPTNFNKTINNVKINSYHFIHISALTHLYKFTKLEFLHYFALKWINYTDEKWPYMDILKGKYSVLNQKQQSPEELRARLSSCGTS